MLWLTTVVPFVIGLFLARPCPVLAARRARLGYEEEGAEEPDASAAEGIAEATSGPASQGLDIGGLQRSLRDGGVEGLNKMLKAMQSMGSAGAASMAAHIKKDADGNEIYDFRDLGVSTPGPTVAPPSSLEEQLPSTSGRAPYCACQTILLFLLVPVPSHHTEAATAAASVHFQGAGAAGQAAQHKATNVQPHSTQAQPQGGGPVAAKTLVAAIADASPTPPVHPEPLAGAHPPLAPTHVAVLQERSITAISGASKVQDSISTPVDPVPQGAPPTAVAAASGPQPQVSAAELAAPQHPDGQLSAIALGLDEVRRGVDTLVTLNLRQQGSKSAETGQEPSAENRQVLKRVDELEKENSLLQEEVRQQATRLKAVEDFEHSEDLKLDEAIKTNQELRAELKTTRGHRKVSLLGHNTRHGRRHQQGHQQGHSVRTVFHSKDRTPDQGETQEGSG